jgi:hypothetical protein
MSTIVTALCRWIGMTSQSPPQKGAVEGGSHYAMWDNRLSEPVLNLNIEARRAKYPMDQIFQLRAVDVV